MRKLANILFYVFFLSSLTIAGTITVTSPLPGADWHKGTTQTIRWTSSGCTDTSIKINIFRNTTDPVNFVEQLTCTGCSSKSWTIPEGYTDGNYIIRVKTADNICFGDSAVFNISPPPFVSTGTITVINPSSSTSFYVTQWALGINWSNTGENHENVSIEVIPEGNPAGAMVILASTPNDGDHEWRDPGSLTGAGRFYIRVKTLDGAVWGDSEVYQVNEHSAPESIILVNSPGSRALWNVNSPRMINWNKSGEMDERVSIKLYNSSGTTLIRTISDDTANDEEEHWIVPADLTAGTYIIRITTLDGEVSGDSDLFEITRPDDPVTDPRTPIIEEEAPPADPRTPIVPGKTINIKFPNNRSIWRSGQKGEIVWSHKPSMNRRVKIELFKERDLRVNAVISADTENDGSFLWKIPPIIVSGKFLIKITTLDGANYGVSEIFTINSKLSGLRKMR